MSTARSDPPTHRTRAVGHAAQQWEQKWAERAKEKRIRRREHLEQYNEEYRLCEQQGLSPLPALVNSSSDEAEESDGGRAIHDRWEPVPPSPRAEGVAMGLVPEAGLEPPAVGSSEEVPAGAAEAPAGAAEVPPSPRGEQRLSLRTFDFEGQLLTLSLLSLQG
jgi:hypothetical protein